jgi:hypothetical protein
MIPPRVPTGKVEMAGTAHQPWRKTRSGQKDTTANERAWIRAGHREDRRTSIEGEVSKAGDRPDAPDGSEERPAFPKPAETLMLWSAWAIFPRYLYHTVASRQQTLRSWT